MTKKVIPLLLVFTLLFSLCACGKKTKTDTAETTTEAKQTDLTPAYSAYLELLTKRKKAILGYYWQPVYDKIWKNDTSDGEPRSVAIVDVYGDDTPELIYIDTDPNEEYSSQSTLHIVTFYNNKTVELYKSDWDFNGGGWGLAYTLCFVKNDSRLYLFSSSADSYEAIEYDVLDEADGPSLKKTELIYKYVSYDGPGSTIDEEEYRINGTASDSAAVDAAAAKLESQWTSLVMNTCNGDTQKALVKSGGDKAMTVDEAITYLKKKVPEASSKSTSWESAYKSFIFNEEFLTSAAGEEGYGTEMDYDFGLYDLDSDGTPELLIFNGYDGRAICCRYCYGYVDGAVCYMGICPEAAYYFPGSKYKGLFGCYMDGWAYTSWSYYSKNGSTVSSELIYQQTGEDVDGDTKYTITQKTSDDSLYQASKQELTLFKTYSADDINTMGWDAFIATVPS